MSTQEEALRPLDTPPGGFDEDDVMEAYAALEQLYGYYDPA